MSMIFQGGTTILGGTTARVVSSSILKYDVDINAGFFPSTTGNAGSYETGTTTYFSGVLNPSNGTPNWSSLVSNFSLGGWHVTGHPEMVVTNVQANVPSTDDVTVTITGGTFDTGSYSFSGPTYQLGLLDLAGYENDGALHNNPGIVTNHPRSFAFTGTEYIQAANNNYFTGGDFTVTAWVYITNNTSYSRIFDFGNGENSDNVILAMEGSSYFPTFHIYDGGSDSWVTSSAEISTGVWTHYAVTYSNGAGILYLNGVSVGSNGMHRPNNVVRNNCYIGKSNWASDSGLEGNVSKFAIYRTAMTGTEVLADFNRTKATYGL